MGRAGFALVKDLFKILRSFRYSGSSGFCSISRLRYWDSGITGYLKDPGVRPSLQSALRLVFPSVYSYAGQRLYRRRVTIDVYTNVISLWSALILMMILFPCA
jgi:hypothetical protein